MNSLTESNVGIYPRCGAPAKLQEDAHPMFTAELSPRAVRALCRTTRPYRVLQHTV